MTNGGRLEMCATLQDVAKEQSLLEPLYQLIGEQEQEEQVPRRLFQKFVWEVFDEIPISDLLYIQLSTIPGDIWEGCLLSIRSWPYKPTIKSLLNLIPLCQRDCSYVA